MAMPRGIEPRTRKGRVCGRFLLWIVPLIGSIFEPRPRMLFTRLPEYLWKKVAALSRKEKNFPTKRWQICCRYWALAQTMPPYSSSFLPIQLLLPWKLKDVPPSRSCHDGSKALSEPPVGVESLN